MPTYKQEVKSSKTTTLRFSLIAGFVSFTFTIFFIIWIFLMSIFYFGANLEYILQDQYPEVITDFNRYLDTQIDSETQDVKNYLNQQSCPRIGTYLPDNAYERVLQGFNQEILTPKHPILAKFIDQMDPYVLYDTFEDTVQQKAVFKFNNTLYILMINENLISSIDHDLAYAITSCYLGQKKASKSYKIKLVSQEELKKIVQLSEQKFQQEEDKYLQQNRDYIKYAQEQIAYLDDLKKRYDNYSWIESQKKEWQKGIQEAKQYISDIEQYKKDSKNVSEHLDSLSGYELYKGDVYINLDSNRDPDCFLSILIHEVLHKLSDNDDYQLPSIWEEGLTDLLAQKIFEQTVPEGSFCRGYDDIDQIEELLFKNVSKQDLIDIYFSKDINKIRQTIDKQFGQGTFEKISPELQRIYEESWDGTATEQDVRDVIEKFGLER